MERKRAHWPVAGAAVAGVLVIFLSGSVLGCKPGKASTTQDTPAQGAGADKSKGAAIAVALSKPQAKTVQGELVLNGILHAEDEVQVVAETQGKVTGVFVQVGSRVAKGDLLAQIDDELKKASFDTAQAAFDKSKADWARAQDLYAQKVITDVDRQGLKLAFASANAQFVMAKRDLENARVTAPQAGVVTKTSVSVGSILGPGASVAYIVDAANLKMTVQVGEREVLKIKAGMKVEVDSDLYPGSSFQGTVSGVSPKGDSALSFPVEIRLATDPRRPLYDGMSAKARIDLGSRTILAIPRSSLVGSYQKPQAYLARGGSAKLVDITVGGEYGTDLEVLGGLSASDDVVVDGQNNLYDGAPVAVVGAVK
jgi:membrane fusion protein, multidrug efflux system